MMQEAIERSRENEITNGERGEPDGNNETAKREPQATSQVKAQVNSKATSNAKA